MIPFYSPPETDARLWASLAAGLKLQPAHSWLHFERCVATAECSVLLFESLARDEALVLLTRLTRRFPVLPLVLLTRKDAENARHLKSVVVEEVVWLCEADTALPTAVAAACLQRSMLQLEAALHGADHLPAKLREALAVALRSDPPIRSVAALGRAVGRDRRTLSRLWKESVSARAPLRLEDLLDWVLLLQALRRRAAGRKWAAVAAGLGVHEHTLRRLALRLLGTPLRAPGQGGAVVAARRFSHLLQQSLLSSTLGWDILREDETFCA